MSWTGRPDNQACCGDSPGAIDAKERVAHLIHSRNSEPPSSGLKRDTLQPNGDFSNNCGDSDGLSVDRCDGLSIGQLRERSTNLAEIRVGRTARGARIASVQALRAIGFADDPNGRAVYVYDDPRNDNSEHAVIRVTEHAGRPEFELIRTALIDAFSETVTQED